jgi:hypothetical protein
MAKKYYFFLTDEMKGPNMKKASPASEGEKVGKTVHIEETKELFLLRRTPAGSELRKVSLGNSSRSRRTRRICNCSGVELETCCCVSLGEGKAMGCEHNGGVCCCGLAALAAANYATQSMTTGGNQTTA